MIQTVLFDFDGTLFDTGEGILRSVQYALEGFGIHETDTARLRKFVGPPLLDSFSELYAMTPEQAQEQYVDVLCASLVQKAFWQDASNWVGGAKFLTEICTANGSLTAVEMGVGSIALNPRWLMLTMLDRSEQLRHESELDMLLAELRATLESAADGMLVCDLRGGIRAFNHRFAELWQLPEPLLVQRDDAAVFAHLEAQTISSESQFTLLQDAQDLSAPETSEVLQLLSGRVLERRSVPQVWR